MEKRKFSFLADEDDKYEKEYQRKLAEKEKLKEAEIKKTIADKDKQGVSIVSGNISPTVGEKITYHIAGWYPDTPNKDRNPAKVTWELFKKRKNGKFTTTNIKKVGVGSFTFGEVASQHTYRLEAYLHKPEGGGLIINPKPSKIPKIGKVEFHYVDDEKGDTFSFHDKLRAKAHTTNLVGKELIFTLWEDDAKGKGHNANNKAIDSKPAQVDDNGLAIAEFMLTKALIEKAMQGEADAKQLEFYVTVEYYIGKKHDSENVNINNPLYKAPAVPKKKNGKPKAKDSPAEQKPISKKEEKGIVSIAMENLWDWAESKGKALKDLEIRLPKIEGKSMVGVKKQERKKQAEECVCKQYNLVWGGHSNVSCEFRKKVVDISKRQNFDPNHLMAVIYVESAHTFSTSKIELKVIGHRKNGNAIYGYVPLTKDEVLKLSENFVGAVGLIQFTPEAIIGLNNKYGLSLTKRKLALMSQLDQLDYVEKYIAMWKETNKITSKLTLADLYLAVFAPSKMNGSDDNTIVYSKESKYYEPNSSIDKDNNGISKKELAARAYDSFSLGLTNKESNFECENVKEETTTVKSSADSGFYIYKNGTIKYVKAQDSINYYIQEKEGSNNFIKLYTLTKNSFGLVKFPDSGNGFGRYGGVDTGGTSAIENVGKGDHYLLPQTAAALFGIISEVKDKNWEVHFGDMSSENGSDPTSSPEKAKSHHAGHGHKGKQSGLNIDFRYLNKNGKSFQGTSSSNSFDDLKNKEFFRISFKFGFNKNYATGKNYPGVNPRVGSHYDHGHIGTLSINFETVEKLNVNIIK